MKYMICYDISEDKIRSKIVQYLEEFSYRIQFSVFTCQLNAADEKRVWKNLLDLTKNAKNPLLLMMPICKSCEKNMRLHGKPMEEDKTYFVI